MIFNSLIKTKDQLTTLPEDATLAEALTVLENTGFRCVPVLDKTGTIFAATSTRCTSIGINHDMATWICPLPPC